MAVIDDIIHDTKRTTKQALKQLNNNHKEVKNRTTSMYIHIYNRHKC